jgi:parallel beta-helix repeat protein
MQHIVQGLELQAKSLNAQATRAILSRPPTAPHQHNRSANALYAAAIVVFGLVIAQPPAHAATITLSPADNLQSAVDSNPVNTTFVLTPGTYRMQSVVPKQGDSFTGQAGAIMNGAKALSGWTQTTVSGVSYWTVAGGTPLAGSCNSTPCCMYTSQDCISPQDLYVDNVEYQHVTSLANVAAGISWYYDFDGTDGGIRNNIYLAATDNPNSHTVELGDTRCSFTGNASNVTIKNLTIEKYAAPISSGVINIQGANWLVQRNEVTLSHGIGISAGVGGDYVKVLNNNVNNIGQMGVGGPGNHGLWDSNTIAYNNTDNVTPAFEAGGSKWAGSNNTISNNIVHDNQGTGLWSDVHSKYDTYDHNTSYNNYAGIRYEVSTYGTITNNTVYGNGLTGNTVGQINAVDSAYLTISGNTVYVGIPGPWGPGTFGIGIGNDGRSDGFKTTNVEVTNNTVTFSSAAAALSVVGLTDYDNEPDIFTYDGNYFDYNTYYVPVLGEKNWYWGENPKGRGINPVTWSAWQDAGQDLHGSVILPTK